MPTPKTGRPRDQGWSNLRNTHKKATRLGWGADHGRKPGQQHELRSSQKSRITLPYVSILDRPLEDDPRPWVGKT